MRRIDFRNEQIRFVVVSLLVMTCLATPVLGQGTNRRFPDPMSFAEMTELLAPLGLSSPQTTAIGAEHAGYLEAMKALRAGDIARYLAAHGSLAPAFQEERGEVVAAMAAQRSILRAIAAHENAFFDAIGVTLAEDQRAMLPRLAARRERERLSTDPSGQGWQLPPLARFDLVALIDEIELDDDVRAAIDSTLAAYESALTPQFRKVHAARLDMPVARFDRMAAARAEREARVAELREQFDLETDIGRAEYARAAAESVRGPSVGGQEEPELEPVREGYVRISRLDRRLLSDLAAHLEADDRARLGRRVERRAYGRLGIPGDPLQRRVAKHLDDDSTPADLREALAALIASYRADRAPLVNDLIAHAEDEGFGGRTANVFRISLDGKPADEVQDPVAKARTAIRELNDSALQRYARLTGEEVPKSPSHAMNFVTGEGGSFSIELPDGGAVSIDVGEGEGGGDGEVVFGAVHVLISADTAGEDGVLPVQSLVVGDVAAMDFVVADSFTGEFTEMAAPALPRPRGWLPGPIDARSIELLGEDLALDDDDRHLLEAIHEDYMQSFAALDEGLVGVARSGMKSAQEQMWNPKGEGLDADAVYGDVRSAMAAIAGLDRGFFDDVALVLDRPGIEDAVARAARARQREAHLHLGSDMYGGPGFGSREASVDLVALSTTPAVHLAADDAARAREALGDWDLESVQLYLDRWDTSLTVAQQQAENMTSVMHTANANGAFVSATSMSDDGALAAASRRKQQIERSLRSLNHETLRELGSALGSVGRSTFRSAYEREAFPMIFRDRSALERTLDKALDLELDTTTRGRLETLCLDYRAAYARICDRMVERVRTHEREGTPFGGIGQVSPEAVQEHETLSRDLDADRFERRDLNERTRQALEDLLGQDLAAKIGLRAGD